MNHEKSQADSIARISRIELSDEQVNQYCETRQSQDKEFIGLSDQTLLYLVLEPSQRVTFKKEFRHISFSEIDVREIPILRK